MRFLYLFRTAGVDAGNRYFAGGGTRQSAEDPDSRCLACPVGAEESEYLSLIYVKGKVVIRHE